MIQRQRQREILELGDLLNPAITCQFVLSLGFKSSACQFHRTRDSTANGSRLKSYKTHRLQYLQEFSYNIYFYTKSKYADCGSPIFFSKKKTGFTSTSNLFVSYRPVGNIRFGQQIALP
jgi:hypothetical protein